LLEEVSKVVKGGKVMRNKKLMLLAVVVMVFVWTSIAQARGHGEGYGRGDRQDGQGPSEEMVQKMEEKLGITEEQSVQLKAHRIEHKEKMKALKNELKEKREALKEELEKGDASESSIQGVASELKNVQSELVDERINGILAVKSILTPEQYEKFKEKTKKNHSRKEKSREKGGPRSRSEE